MRSWITCIVLAFVLRTATEAQVGLEAGFSNPPASAKPHTWWHWMNGNITREGITADLEAIAQAGLGGVQVFNVSESIPDGPVLFMSTEWRALFKHAVSEAERLGLEVCLHNCAGWSSSGGPWIKPADAMQTVVVSETRVSGATAFSGVLPRPETRLDYYRDIAVLAFPTPADDTTRIRDIRPKAGYEARYGQQPLLDEYAAEAVVKRAAIVDLTARLQSDGRLTWDVPAGAWTILRIGYTPTGAVNAPSPVSGRGLECDKLSRAGMDAHWAGAIAPLISDLGPLAGRRLNNALIDSYEVGHQNWTAGFREEFARRRGYDLLAYLPVLSGRVVESGEVSERFLWDFRRTIADLFADNYYTYFAELCRQHSLLASIEPYDGPFECLLTGRDADIPMGEFWVGGGESSSCKLAASVAHTYGRALVGAEAFTADPRRGRWLNDPFALKGIGDLMYTVGINRYILHRYAHQPWLDRYPGMTMGQWGTHFDRTNTWWKPGAAWVRYLARCQYLLQQGRFVADVCFFAGETAPNGAPHMPDLKAQGYDYDACNADVLLNRMTVRDGRLVLPDGMSYRVLVLPDTPFMTVGLARKIRELVEAGATVLGPRPERSPSLSDYPDGDAVVRRIADEVWGDCDGRNVKERAFGRGRVHCGLSVVEVLGRIGAMPDCREYWKDARFGADSENGAANVAARRAAGSQRHAWIHRVGDDADIYFISNPEHRSAEFNVTFRVSGKAPELWHADSGEIEPALIWSESQGHTTVPIRLDPAGSVFVVFRRPAAGVRHFTGVTPPEPELPEPGAPTIDIRSARYEAIDGAGGANVTAKVAELVAAGETNIPANNATFGDPTYLHEKRLRVEYSIDGRACSATVNENETLVLIAEPPAALPDHELKRIDSGACELVAFRAGEYALRGAGREIRVKVDPLPEPLALSGPWTVRFPPNWGAPAQVTLPELISWSEHADAGVRYFSGTAEYEHEFALSAEWLSADRRVYLDLGRVKNIAEVTLNGVDLGVWWKPPFAGEVTRHLKAGKNELRVRVTNLWVNRLIGDEQHPDDCEWEGIHLKRWPQWLVDGAPRPVRERVTFTTWKHWRAGSRLLESGMLGPARLVAGARVGLE